MPAGEFDASNKGNGRLVNIVAEGLDAANPHTLEIVPLLNATWRPEELRIESICVAGGEAKVWRLE